MATNNSLRVPWNVLHWNVLQDQVASEINEFRKINSGIHIAMMGTTRGGKTTLATGGKSGNGLLSHFEDVLVIDSTGDPGFISEYGKPLNRYGGIHGHRRLTVSDMSAASREKIAKTIGRAVRQGNIAIYADEVRQLTDKKFFGLGPLFDHIWLFTAKRGVSLIGGSQAPRWLPSAFYDQSKMHFIFGIRDIRARKRMYEISGDIDTLEPIVPTLPRYWFAYVGLDGDVSVSKFELNSRKATPKRVVVQQNPPRRVMIY